MSGSSHYFEGVKTYRRATTLSSNILKLVTLRKLFRLSTLPSVVIDRNTEVYHLRCFEGWVVVNSFCPKHNISELDVRVDSRIPGSSFREGIVR